MNLQRTQDNNSKLLLKGYVPYNALLFAVFGLLCGVFMYELVYFTISNYRFALSAFVATSVAIFYILITLNNRKHLKRKSVIGDYYSISNSNFIMLMNDFYSDLSKVYFAQSKSISSHNVIGQENIHIYDGLLEKIFRNKAGVVRQRLLLSKGDFVSLLNSMEGDELDLLNTYYIAKV